MKFKFAWLAAAVAAATFLSACGGGGDDAPPSQDGQVLSAQLAGSIDQATFAASVNAKGLTPLAGAPKCGVDVRYVLYVTKDPLGQPATASAGVLVPNGTDPACTGNRPVVLYAHGTTFTHSKNMADLQNDSEAGLMAAMFVGQGFIVVAPNFLGYDKSSLTYHPYLNAESSALDMIDGLRAAKTHLNGASAVRPSDKLFVTGYSQGGHVAAATQKVMERDYSAEFTVTASGPMSGPHNLFKTVSVINSSPTTCAGTPNPNCTVNAGGTLFTPLLLTSWQKSYGNVYASPSDAYQAPFAATAETLFPTDTPISDLVAAGKLPADPTFTKLFGTGGLINESYRAAFFSDPNNGFAAAAKKNTLVGGWTPKRPMALCGGAQDPTVFFFNTTDLQADLNSRLPAQLAVPAFNMEDRASLPAGPVGDQLYGGFQQQKAAAGANATALYHGTLVPPFCTALVRGFFQQVLAAGL
jgi:poly(3-hydroxybutyrate) depolymerase